MPTVTIKRSDSSPETRSLPNGILGMLASGSASFSVADSLVALTVTDDLADRDFYYQRIFKDVIEHTGNFTSSSGYYLSRINGVTPLSGGIALLGGPSERIYEDGNIIYLKNIARADLDCDDYIRIKEYLMRIKAVLDGIKEQIVNAPAESEGVVTTYGVHRQYQSMQHLWNFLVRNLSLILNISYQENSEDTSDVYMQIKVHNNTDTPYVMGAITVAMVRPVGPVGAYIKQIKTVKITRTTQNAKRISFTVDPAPLTSRSLYAPEAEEDTISWIFTPRTVDTVPTDVTVGANETISASIQFQIYGQLLETGTISLPSQLYFIVSTNIKDDMEGGTVVPVSRGRSVYIHTTELTYTPPEE